MTPTEQTEHMPWDEPWPKAGVPSNHSYWTTERVDQADQLVSDFLKTDFDRVIRDGLSAERKVRTSPTRADVPHIAVSNEHNEVHPIIYDNRHLSGMATDGAIRYARGETDGE